MDSTYIYASRTPAARFSASVSTCSCAAVS
jgi:hypothetical protein